MVNINMRVEIFLMLTLNVFGQSAPQSQSVINFGRFPIPNEEDFYQPDQNYRPENSEFSQNYGNSENYEQSQQQNQQSNFLPTTQKSPSREPGEISQTKCNEYSRTNKGNVQFASLSLGSRPQNISPKSCDKLTGLVVGGTSAKLNEFPHQAAIGYLNFDGKIEYSCGGSLISELFVLTAAHCRNHPESNSSPTTIRLGDINLKVREPESPEIDVPIDRFISHEKYQRSTKENDIALVKMAYAVTFTPSIRPACLQIYEDIGTFRSTATGWGRTGVHGPISDILQKVPLTIFSNQVCGRFYEDIKSSQMCAGVLTGGKDTCEGDSGGPLQIMSDNQCVFTIVGVTSYGSFICGSVNSPGVYTRVSSFIEWIESKVWN